MLALYIMELRPISEETNANASAPCMSTHQGDQLGDVLSVLEMGLGCTAAVHRRSAKHCGT